MILFYQKIAMAPHGDGIIAKCSNCGHEYFARYRKCNNCGSESKEWIIDLYDESHHKKKKRRRWFK